MGTESVRILVVADGRHVFRYLTDPRVDLVKHDQSAPTAFEPDIIVYPFAKRFVLAPDGHGMDPSRWARVREGRARLVIDACAELRPHSPQVSEALHRFLQDLQIPAGNVAYLTEDRLYAGDYKKWVKREGKGEKIPVHYVDYCMRAFARSFTPEGEGERRLGKKEKNFQRRSVHRPKTFIALNRSLRPHKAALLARLLRDGLWDRGFISAGRFPKGFERPQFVKRLVEAQLGALVREVVHQIGEIDARLTPDLGWSPSDGLDTFVQQHSDSYFSLVTETEMLEHPQRITEKPLKALANFQPLLLMGNVGGLKILRDYGFQTFGGYVDESYDLETNPLTRFEMVYAEFQRLCGLSEQELYDREQAMTDVLRHNARNMLLNIPNHFVTKHDPELIDALVPRPGV